MRKGPQPNALPEVLICWSGKDSEPTAAIGNLKLVDGPITQTLTASENAERFSHCVVLYVDRTRRDFDALQAALERRGAGAKLVGIRVDLKDPTDHAAIRASLASALQEVTKRFPPAPMIDAEAPDADARFQWSVLLNPGTPQMRTVWLTLAHFGELPAKLLQSTPARIAREEGLPLLREVSPEEALGYPAGASRSSSAPHAPSHQAFEALSVRTPADAAPPKLILGGTGASVRALRTKLFAAAQASGPLLLTGEQGCGQEACAQRFLEHRFGGELPLCIASTQDAECLAHLKSLGDATRVYTSPEGSGHALLIWVHGSIPPDLQSALRPLLTARVPLILAADALQASLMQKEAELQSLTKHAVALPTLRSRKRDIPWLANRLVAGANRWFTPQASTLLADYSWPGNFAEFRRLMVALSAQGQGAITPTELPAYCRKASVEIPRMSDRVEAVQRVLIEEALAACKGNRSAAARELGISRTTLLNRLKAFAMG